MIRVTLNKIRPCHLRTNHEARVMTTLALAHQGRPNNRELSLRTIKNCTLASHMVGNSPCSKPGPRKTLPCNAALCQMHTCPAWLPTDICLEGLLVGLPYLTKGQLAACFQAPRLADKPVVLHHRPDPCLKGQCLKGLCILGQRTAGPGRSLEVHNQEDQYLDSKTSDQACRWIVDCPHSASPQVTELQAHLQRRTALHLPLQDRLITATALIRQRWEGRRTNALPWKTGPQVRLPRRTASLRQHRMIVHLALRLPNSDLLRRRYQVHSSMGTISLLTLTHFPAILYRSDLGSTMAHLHQNPHRCATMLTTRIHRQAVGLNRSPSLPLLTMAAALAR
jgi:hypothetical protein